MPLNKQKGNMYSFVTHTWNPIKGKCYHECSYCYMKRWGYQKPIRLVEKELKTKLGGFKTVFVGSGTDMFANNVPSEWIQKVIDQCQQWQENTYLFQTKNPSRYLDFDIPKNFILGTTIETDKWYGDVMGLSEHPMDRAMSLKKIKHKKFITIEPILDFDSFVFPNMLKMAKPDWINIGADSQRSKLPEPSKEKIEGLIEELSGLDIKIKTNMKRISSTFVLKCKRR